MVFEDYARQAVEMLPNVWFLQNRYVEALIIIVGFFVVSQAVVWITEKIILKIATKTKTNLDDEIIKKTNKPLIALLLLIGLWLSESALKLSPAFEAGFTKLILSAIVLVIAWIVIGVIMALINHWGETFAKRTKSDMDDAVIPLFKSFAKIVVFALAILYILTVWGVAVTPLLASLGIAGIAVAFAMQSTLGNILGGISLILDKTVKVGDTIKLDDGITSGVVVDVGLRSTSIRTFDNELMIVPNGKLAESKILNYVLPEPKVRAVLPFGVAYGTDVDKVKKIALNCVKGVEGLLKEPEPSCYFDELGDSALQFKLYFWCENTGARFKAKEIVRTRIYNALNKAKISIPFPQRELWVHTVGKRK